MSRGDLDFVETLQDHRQAWKRLALEGRVSNLAIVLTSKHLIDKQPTAEIKEICRRFLELYFQTTIRDDSFPACEEHLFLRRPGNTYIKFGVRPKLFCAQADGRWWHGRRAPGGVMIAFNALGHLVHVRTWKSALDTILLISTLEHAMRTVLNLSHKPFLPQNYDSPVATLTRHNPLDPCPFRKSFDLNDYSADHYFSRYDTHDLVPSVFFSELDDGPQSLKHKMSFRYIYDATFAPDLHRTIVAGIPATWEEVEQSINRLPTFTDPRQCPFLDSSARARLFTWLRERMINRS